MDTMSQTDPAPVPVLIRLDQGSGDAVLASAAIRDLHLAYPGRFRVWIDGIHQELFKFDPRVEKQPPRYRLGAHRLCAKHFSDRERFLPLWHGWLADALGVNPFPVTAHHGHIVLGDAELSSLSRIRQPYLVVDASSRSGRFETKAIDPADIERAVRAWPSFTFVMVGSARRGLPITGTVDLTGQTTTRELIQLVYHAWGVISPVSFLMHLAAAVPLTPYQMSGQTARHIITLAGGGETPWFYHYPPELNHHINHHINHIVLHTVGTGELGCCEKTGCWIRKLADCRHPEKNIPRCMRSAGGRLVGAIGDCLAGKKLPRIYPPSPVGTGPESA